MMSARIVNLLKPTSVLLPIAAIVLLMSAVTTLQSLRLLLVLVKTLSSTVSLNPWQLGMLFYPGAAATTGMLLILIWVSAHIHSGLLNRGQRIHLYVSVALLSVLGWLGTFTIALSIEVKLPISYPILDWLLSPAIYAIGLLMITVTSIRPRTKIEWMVSYILWAFPAVGVFIDPSIVTLLTVGLILGSVITWNLLRVGIPRSAVHVQREEHV